MYSLLYSLLCVGLLCNSDNLEQKCSERVVRFSFQVRDTETTRRSFVENKDVYKPYPRFRRRLYYASLRTVSIGICGGGLKEEKKLLKKGRRL